MKIVAAIPTRGVVVTECVTSVIRELSHSGHEWGIVFTSGMKIPDCFNRAVQQALDDNADFVWLVEEDVIVPEGGLGKLLAEKAKIAVIDVPSRHVEGLTQVAQMNGTVYWVHTGCTLVAREVFEQMPQPWFQTEFAYDFRLQDGGVVFNERKLDAPLDYGGQDVRFSRKAVAMGIELVVVKNAVCVHCRVEYDAAREKCHKITKIDRVTRTDAFSP